MSAEKWHSIALPTTRLASLDRRFVTSKWHAAGHFVHVARQRGEAPLPGETVLSADEAFAAPQDAGAVLGRVLEQRRSNATVKARIEAFQGEWLLVRRSFDPATTLRVDGRPVAGKSLSPALAGFPVPSGIHEIELGGW